MTPFDNMLGRQPDEEDRRFAAALEQVPESEREIQTKIWEMARDCERTLKTIHADVRDYNVIAARIVGKMEHFLATGEPIKGFGTPRHAR